MAFLDVIDDEKVTADEASRTQREMLANDERFKLSYLERQRQNAVGLFIDTTLRSVKPFIDHRLTSKWVEVTDPRQKPDEDGPKLKVRFGYKAGVLTLIGDITPEDAAEDAPTTETELAVLYDKGVKKPNKYSISIYNFEGGQELDPLSDPEEFDYLKTVVTEAVANLAPVQE